MESFGGPVDFLYHQLQQLHLLKQLLTSFLVDLVAFCGHKILETSVLGLERSPNLSEVFEVFEKFKLPFTYFHSFLD